MSQDNPTVVYLVIGHVNYESTSVLAATLCLETARERADHVRQNDDFYDRVYVDEVTLI